MCTRRRRLDNTERAIICFALTTLPLWGLPALIYAVGKEACREYRDKRQMNREFNAPRPKLSPRHHRVLNLPKIVASKDAKTITTESSILLTKLPLELRLKIWQYVVGDHMLHIIRPPHRLSHIVCTFPSSRPPPTLGLTAPETYSNIAHPCFGDEDNDTNLYHGPYPDRNNVFLFSPTPYTTKLTPLWLVNRQTYGECLPLVYSKNVFDIIHMDALACLKALTPTRNLQYIQNLHLAYNSGDVYREAPPLFDKHTPNCKAETNWKHAITCIILPYLLPHLRSWTVLIASELSSSDIFEPLLFEHVLAEIDKGSKERGLKAELVLANENLVPIWESYAQRMGQGKWIVTWDEHSGAKRIQRRLRTADERHFWKQRREKVRKGRKDAYNVTIKEMERTRRCGKLVG